MTTDNPQVPYSREAEEAVIGSVLISPTVFTGLSSFLKSSDFYIHRSRFIWDAINNLHKRGDPIDLITLSHELERSETLEGVGGSAYLTSLITLVPDSLNAETYGRTVLDYSVRRKLIEYANGVAKSAYDLQKSIVDEIPLIGDGLDNIANSMAVEEHFQPVSHVMGDVYDELAERAKNPTDVWGIPTGLKLFDLETGGMQKGELTFLAGEPGVGKTWLALGIAYEMSEQSPGGFLSMELKRQNVGRRIVSGISGVRTKSMRTGRILDRDWPLITHAIDEASTRGLYLDYNSYTSDQFRNVVRKAKRKYGFEFLFVDYAMLFLDGGDEVERTGHVSCNLKNIATDFDLAVTCIHSVTKLGMDKNGDSSPAKSYMRGSGQQLHDADNVFFLTHYRQTSEKDSFLTKDDRKAMRTLECTKGRELEDSSFVLHLVRRGGSPFFDCYSRELARQARNMPVFHQSETSDYTDH